jgi:hypothetical protein
LSEQPLSPNQVQALKVLRAAGSMTTQAFIDAAPSSNGLVIHTEDQARNLLARLEKRGHLAGDGHGRTRVWTYVHSPELEEVLGAPATQRPARDPETALRTYVVLERRRLDELVDEVLGEAGAGELTEDQADALAQAEAVFDRVDTPEARNTEHALRTAAKEVYGHVNEADPEMVAVASRMFQVEVVKVRNSQTVSIG